MYSSFEYRKGEIIIGDIIVFATLDQERTPYNLVYILFIHYFGMPLLIAYTEGHNNAHRPRLKMLTVGS